MVLDSNIVIYISQNREIKNIPSNSTIYASAITKLEVLGFHRLSLIDKTSFENFFNSIIVLPIDESVINQSIQLRQIRKISLGDAIIASTAIIYRLPLVTANLVDFQWIQELTIIHPFDS